MRIRIIASAIAACLTVVVAVGCSEDTSSPLEPAATPPSTPADVIGGAVHPDHVHRVSRVVGSLLRVPHSWPIVNWSSIRGLNATLDGEKDVDGKFELDIEIDFGSGPILQQTTEDVICLEIADRGDGTTDIWMSHAGLGWVTVPPGVIHYSIAHVVDAPGRDLLAARTIQPDEGDPAEFCETRPDLSATDPTGFGPLQLMAAEAGNVVTIDR